MERGVRPYRRAGVQQLVHRALCRRDRGGGQGGEAAADVYQRFAQRSLCRTQADRRAERRTELERDPDLEGGRAASRSGRARHLQSRHASVRERSEERTSELQSLMRISYAVLCLKKKKT